MRKVCKERGNVAASNVRIEKQLAKGNGRYLLGQGGASKQRAREVVGHRIGNGTAITPILEMNGESYRLKHSRENAASQSPDDSDIE